MENNRNVVVEQQQEAEKIEKAINQQVAGSEEDAILAFIENRAQRYLELDATMDEIEEQKAKEKLLQKKRKQQKLAIADESAMMLAIEQTAGIVTDAEQEQKNRSHYATKAFFDILALADKSGGNFKALYNSFNPIQRVCEAVVASAKYDGDHTIMIDTEKFIGIVKKAKQEQDNAITAAKERLDAEWKKQVAGNPGIQRVKTAVAEDAKKVARFAKKPKEDKIK